MFLLMSLFSPFFKKLKCSWLTMLYQFLLYSNDPVICMYIYAHTYISHVYIHTYTHTHIPHVRCLSYIIIQHRLSQETIPHCLSILNGIVCTYEPQTPHPPHYFWLFLLICTGDFFTLLDIHLDLANIVSQSDVNWQPCPWHLFLMRNVSFECGHIHCPSDLSSVLRALLKTSFPTLRLLPFTFSSCLSGAYFYI